MVACEAERGPHCRKEMQTAHLESVAVQFADGKGKLFDVLCNPLVCVVQSCRSQEAFQSGAEVIEEPIVKMWAPVQDLPLLCRLCAKSLLQNLERV